MGAEKDIIVALEFGTSAIRGIAGRKKADGTIQILGVEHEKATDSIHKGVIYNIDKTTQAITNITERLSDKLNVHINKAYVGISGQSLHSASNVIQRNLEMKVKITPELVDNLMDNNRATEYAESEILDVIPQEYIVGNHSVADAVGIQSDQIEAHFINIVAKTALRENIEKCMRMAGLEVADLFISPIALADVLLSDSEKRSGCALVDFGAGTTTVAVYNGNLLRHLVVIPLGGNNITTDIANSRQMEFDESEAMKRRFGIAYVAADTDNPRMLPISNDRSINENELENIIGARQEEIVANVWHQIENQSDKLLSGVITTGGAAQIKDMTEAIKHYSHFERVKAAKSLVTLADVSSGVVTPQGISIDTLIALLMHGEENCVGERSDVTIELPIEDTPEVPPTTEETPTAKADALEDEKPKKPGLGNKLKKFGRWLSDLVQEPEEE